MELGKKEVWIGAIIFLLLISFLITQGKEDVKQTGQPTLNSAKINSSIKDFCNSARDVGYKKGRYDRIYGIYDKNASNDFYDFNREKGLSIEVSTEAQMCFKDGYDTGFYNRLFK